MSSWKVILGLLILCVAGAGGRRRGGTIPTACCRQQEAEGEQGTGFHLANGVYVVLCLAVNQSRQNSSHHGGVVD